MLLRKKSSEKEDGRMECEDIRELKMSDIHRPIIPVLDEQKVCNLMESIDKDGLQVPIEVLLAPNGKFYSFGGCHRWAAHKKLNKETIKCRVIRATSNMMMLYLGASWQHILENMD